jgi:hypothetical protein
MVKPANRKYRYCDRHITRSQKAKHRHTHRYKQKFDLSGPRPAGPDRWPGERRRGKKGERKREERKEEGKEERSRMAAYFRVKSVQRNHAHGSNFSIPLQGHVSWALQHAVHS